MQTPSLHRRLLGMSLTVLVAALGLTNAGVYVALHHHLYLNLHEALDERAGIVADLAAELPPEALSDRLTRLGIRSTIRLPDGTELKSVPEPPRPQPTLPFAPSPYDGEVLTRQLPSVDGTVITVGVLRSGVQSTLRRLLVVQVAVSSVALLVTAGLLLHGTSVALRPTKVLAATARAIAGGDHARRLRPDRPRTHLGSMACAFDHMVDELATALEETREALADAEAADQRSRRFLADAAHQLRTPITAVSVSLDSLLRAQTEERRERALHHLKAETVRAEQLVHELLALARLDGSPRAAAAVATPLLPAVATEVDRFASAYPAMALTVNAPGRDAAHLRVLLPERDLREALANLLDNAVRHARSTVGILVAGDVEGVRITVTNDGPGLPEELHERVFERFATYGTRTGTGLGLAIVRELLRQHGGDAAYDGSGFTLTLPCTGPEGALRHQVGSGVRGAARA